MSTGSSTANNGTTYIVQGAHARHEGETITLCQDPGKQDQFYDCRLGQEANMRYRRCENGDQHAWEFGSDNLKGGWFPISLTPA